MNRLPKKRIAIQVEFTDSDTFNLMPPEETADGERLAREARARREAAEQQEKQQRRFDL